jgi:mannose-6-phosphate isomerase-like protein (cupin superfamily)
MQRHFLRNELWLVISGSCTLYSKLDSGYSLPPKNLNTHDFIMIDKNSWHQLSNPYDVACRLIEIQFGEDCIESDIERM